MRRRGWIGVVMALLVAASARPALAAARARNVVLISIDTLRADALRPDTPRLPAEVKDLFRRGAVFAHAYSTAAWTLPAHASMLTGLYPDRHGANHPARIISDDSVTLATVLHAQGLETAAFTGSGYVDRGYGLGAGFDQYDVYVDPGSQYRRRELLRDGASEPVSVADHFDRAIAWLRQYRPHRDRPFFLFLHSFAVHDYFRRRASWYEPDESQDPSEADGYLDCVRGRISCPESDWEFLRESYRDDVEAVSRDIANVLRTLDQRGLRSSTLIVVTADHGEGFDPARGRVHHGGRLHADVVRIPLVIAGPSVTPGVRAMPASLVDVMPTVLAQLGARAVTGLDGVALPLAQVDPPTSPRVLYAMENYYWLATDDERNALDPNDDPLGLAVITPESWYIRAPGDEQWYAQTDVDQADNLIADGKDPVEMRRLADARDLPLDPLPSAVANNAPAAAPDEHALSPDQVDTALAERLRALGYRR